MVLLSKQFGREARSKVQRFSVLAWGIFIFLTGGLSLFAQGTQPLVAVHDSEYTRALETMNASGATPTGSGTTGKQWWPTDWHYFVMPEAVKESFRSDGTAFTVVGDSNIIAGALLTNGVPVYPIVISLASEAIHDSEIAQFTNYVAAGGFLFVGSSSFTRNTNGTSRGNFAIASAMGINMQVSGLSNWANNSTYTRAGNHRINNHVPAGTLTWRLPSSSEEIPYGVASDPAEAHPDSKAQAPHDVWQVVNNNATVIAQGAATPFLTVKQYGKGYIIYCAAMQPLLGNGGWAPTMYAYLTMRRSVEWAFETVGLPVAKLSPWPYQYDAAFMVRHDLESFSNEIALVETSAQYEFTNGCTGDYYFCTGTLREDMSPAYNTNSVVASLRRAMTNYGAIIGPHNGGLTNPMIAGTPAAYDYWHWGPDEVLDITPPPGYSSGSNYAYASLSRSFQDIESWLPGLMTNGMRIWCAPYYNGTREASLNIQAQLGVKITGEQKVAPFPHWTLSTQTPNKRFAILSQPVSDWFVGSQISHSMESAHTTGTIHSLVDFYYGLGALVNQYSHSLSQGFGRAGPVANEYVLYAMNTNRFPRLWSANGIKIYNWWVQRSNVVMTVSTSTNGNQISTIFNISNSANTNTTVELLTPAPTLFCNLQIYTNGFLAGTNMYRTSGQVIKLRVGTSVTNAVINYYGIGGTQSVLAQNFDGGSTPSLPSGWSNALSGAASAWVTQASTADSAPNSVFSPSVGSTGYSDLISPAIALSEGQAQLSFRNNYDFESGTGGVAYDGGVLEIKIGTGAFTDIITAGGSFVSGGYSSVIDSTFASPIAGRSAWSGSSGGYLTTLVNLPLSASGKTVQFRWRNASDNGGVATGWRIDSINVNNRVCLCCVTTTNSPVLPAQIDRTVNETATLTVTNTATDADAGDTLFYALVSPPSGAVIDGGGIITWTPSVAFGGTTNLLRTVVTDGSGNTATNSFLVTVLHVNTGPVLPTQTNRTINELTTLTVTNTATDTDVPVNILTYSLLSAPGSASISASGIITWATTEADGPGSYTFTTRVVDNGAPQFSATNSFVVTVNEVNTAPTLPAQTNRTINELTALNVSNAASDSDIPANTITYQLLSPPSGVSISGSGQIAWAPTEAQGPSTNTITTVASDGLASVTNSFTVIVSEVNIAPVLPGQTNRTIAELTLLTVTNTATDADIPTNSLTYQLLNAPSGAAISTNGVFTWTPTEVQGPATNTITTVVNDGTVSVTNSFVVTVTEVNVAPVFPAQTNRTLAELTLLTVTNTATDADLPVNALTYQLVNPPGNAAISTDGVITWTPQENEGPGSGTLTTIVSDGSVSVTNSFVVTVTEVNQAPILPVQINQTIAELTTLLVTNTATDADLPANSLTYQLLSAPSGAVINASGVISWTPTEAQGPATNTITTVVSDGLASVTNSFNVIVSEVNVAPVLPAQTNRTIAELTLLIVTNTATDADQPANPLTYQLINAPSGAAINSSGVITWTPTEAQGPATNTIITVVSDGALSATNSFLVAVTEVNSAPVLLAQTNRIIAELTLLTVTNTATDVDQPANPLTYQLINAPVGAGIDTNGVITWTPTEAQGPSTNQIVTVVNDGTASVTNSFVVVVNEVNQAPVFVATPLDQSVAELALFTVTNAATDADLPANALTYQLLAAPAGASIDTNGVITWTPTEAQGPSTNQIVTVASDGIVSVTNGFAVVVLEVNSAPLFVALPADRIIPELSLLTVTNVATDADLPANILTYQLLAAPAAASIDSAGVITWTPTEAQGPSTNIFTTRASDGDLSATNSFVVIVTEVNSPPSLAPIASRTIHAGTKLSLLCLGQDSNGESNNLAFSFDAAPLGAEINSTNGQLAWLTKDADAGTTNSFAVRLTDDGLPPLSDSQAFTVIVVGRPLIQNIVVVSNLVTVTWTAIVGQDYRLQGNTDLISTNWVDLGAAVTSGGATASQTNSVTGNALQFYRVRLVP